MPSSHKPSAPFIVHAGADRRGNQHLIGRDSCTVKVSASDTGGAFALFEFIGRT